MITLYFIEISKVWHSKTLSVSYILFIVIIDIDIEGFMIQGGDPTNTGKGGESVWGHPFIDEFHPDYNHGNVLF
jgi:hypothetical protein